VKTLAVLAFLAAGISAAAAQPQVLELPLDHDARVNGIGMACTGVGSDSRIDPRWNDYSLKVEFVADSGEYLGFVDVTLRQQDRELAHVRCPGPWMLFQLPPGRYDLEAWVGQQPAKFKAQVREAGQSRVVVRFPG
jgi:hypothetical protein